MVDLDGLGNSLEAYLLLCEVIALLAQIAEQALEGSSTRHSNVAGFVSSFQDASLIMCCFLCLTLFLVKFALIFG
jgi:hypothetical protein